MFSLLNKNIFQRRYFLYFAAIFLSLVIALIAIKYQEIALYSIAGILLLIIFCRFPAVSFGLFLTSGIFKADPILSFLPGFFDLTIFFGFAVVLSILIKILKKKFYIPAIPLKLLLPYLGLIFLMLLSLSFTPSPIYGTDKFLRFLTITALATFAPLFLVKNIKTLKRFFYVLITLSTLMVLNSFISGYHQLTSFHSAFSSDYLILGRVAGISALLIVYYFLIKNNVKHKSFWILLLLFNLFGLFFSGGKSPVLGFLIVLIIVGIMSFGIKIPKAKFYLLRISSIILFSAVIILIFQPNFFGTFLTRLNKMLSTPEVTRSVTWRLNAFKIATNTFYNYPIFGAGVGSFSHYYYGYGKDVPVYPHNIFLEVSSELGLLGLFLLLILLGFSFSNLLSLRKIYYKEREKYFLTTLILAVLIFMLLNTCVSGDINDARLFFVWVGISYALRNILKYKNFTRRSFY